jgi:hypothetical protein
MSDYSNYDYWTDADNADGTNKHIGTPPLVLDDYKYIEIVPNPDPVVNWPTGLTATYGQTLADISLPGNGDGTAGVFSWTAGGSTSVGNAGTRSFNLTFTPTDTENVNTVSQDITVTVNESYQTESGVGKR